MAIPKKIIDITSLALQDRILTHKERQTIVAEALKMGVDEVEISRFIDTAFSKRLQSYTKEELKRCPSCGAQIPLISDECFYCGCSLEVGDQKRQVIQVAGSAADIIRAENQQTADEQQNIQQCPDCGAPFPLVSHICTHCGHVLHAQVGSELNIKQLLSNINASIDALRNAPKPGFFRILWFNIEVVLFFMGLILVLGRSGNDLCSPRDFYQTCGFSLFVICALTVMFGNRDWSVTDGTKASPWKKSPVEAADKAYYDALNQYKMHTSQANTLYGKSDEARTVLDSFAAQIRKERNKRTINRILIAIIYIAMIAVTVTLKISTL